MTSLPAILCLHGTGTNAQIFTIQLSPLHSLLSQTFDFVFLTGPFETVAGDSILPFFSAAEPFFRWKSKSDDNFFTHEEIEPEVRELVKKTLEMRDDWVGILGFSQGGRVAAGLVVEQEREEEEMGELVERGFRFGVFLNTPCPPMTGMVYQNEEEGGKEVRMRMPSLVVRGMKDGWYENCGEMFERYFDKETAKMVEFDVEHRVPGNLEDVKVIAREILRLYLEVTGVRGRLNV